MIIITHDHPATESETTVKDGNQITADRLDQLELQRDEWKSRALKAERNVKTLKRWLKDAAWEIHVDLQAAGPDEVKQNPTLNHKLLLLRRIEKRLARMT